MLRVATERMDKKKRDKFVRYNEGVDIYHMSQSKFMQLAKDAKTCIERVSFITIGLSKSENE